MSSPDTWLMNGRFRAVVDFFEGKHPKDSARSNALSAPELTNWSLALLNLGLPEQALHVSKEAVGKDSSASSFHLFQAVCAWLVGNRREAADASLAAQNCLYQDSGGGVDSASITYYLGKRLNDDQLLKLSKRRLQKLCKPGGWPKPIAFYLLGRTDEQVFLEAAEEAQHLSIRTRQLCQANFWAGFVASNRGDSSRAIEFFKEARSIPSPALLEPEYYLADWEIVQLTKSYA